MMRVGVVGNVNRDTITAADGQISGGLGGVLYTLLALSRLWPDAEIWPLTRVGGDVSPEVQRLLAACGMSCTPGLLSSPLPNYHCHLSYGANGDKVERLLGSLPPLMWEEIEPLVGRLDALLVNFITGHEIEVDALSRLRQRTAGPVVMDLHSLLLGTRPEGTRYLRRPDGWERWVEQSSLLQMNVSEACTIAGTPALETRELAAVAQSLLKLGPQMVVITRGASGALAVNQAHPGQVFVEPAWGETDPVDTTGCGDVFLAALATGAARSLAPQQLLRSACRAAGEASRLRGVAALSALSPAQFI
jgi:sugar/nucleoside kinase (ribokinase family)